MLITLIILSVLLGLRKAGANTPFIDKSASKFQNKLKKSSEVTDIGNNVESEIKTVAKPIEKKYTQTFKSASYRPYSGSLKI